MPRPGTEIAIRERLAAGKLNSLEVQLLVFLKFGLTTSYDLLAHAGMSAGLTGPVLRRMEEAGLLSCTRGSRRVIRYALTLLGKNALYRSLESRRLNSSMDGASVTFDGAAREALLVWLSEGKDEAIRYLDSEVEIAIAQIRKRARETKDSKEAMISLMKKASDMMTDKQKGIMIANIYQWMKAMSDAAMSKAAEEAMRALHDLVAMLPSEFRIPLD
jgi:DNA-binding PadR family transcriptional regulator